MFSEEYNFSPTEAVPLPRVYALWRIWEHATGHAPQQAMWGSIDKAQKWFREVPFAHDEKLLQLFEQDLKSNNNNSSNSSIALWTVQAAMGAMVQDSRVKRWQSYMLATPNFRHRQFRFRSNFNFDFKLQLPKDFLVAELRRCSRCMPQKMRVDMLYLLILSMDPDDIVDLGCSIDDLVQWVVFVDDDNINPYGKWNRRAIVCILIELRGDKYNELVEDRMEDIDKHSCVAVNPDTLEKVDTAQAF